MKGGIKNMAYLPTKEEEVRKEELNTKSLKEKIVEKEKELESLSKEDSQKERERMVVVKEIPLQEIRSFVDDEGVLNHLLTTEEALSKLLNAGED